MGVTGFQKSDAAVGSSVTGIVVNELGQPEAGARVAASASFSPASDGAASFNGAFFQKFAITDDEGRFAFVHLNSGSVVLYAGKERSFYPETLGGLWGKENGGTTAIEVPDAAENLRYPRKDQTGRCS